MCMWVCQGVYKCVIVDMDMCMPVVRGCLCECVAYVSVLNTRSFLLMPDELQMEACKMSCTFSKTNLNCFIK